ncbi:MAG: undecaprenyl-diphosphate phosphatase [Candidatus Bathyarchaeia archaeon]
MEHLLETVLLGITQGVTEWLPISSTGHLRLLTYFLSLKIPILYDVALHAGTLLVVLFFFRKDVWQILLEIFRLNFKSENGRLALLIAVGTVPTALIGLFFGDFIEFTFSNPLPIALALSTCGVLLYSAKFSKEKTDNITFKAALVLGTAQGIAIIPGFSRSGATLAVALLWGLRREKAFKFSFLLSVPAVVGALALTLVKEQAELVASGFGVAEILVGVAVAMLVGFLSLKLLQKVVKSARFHLFAFYCWLLGAVLVLLVLAGF